MYVSWNNFTVGQGALQVTHSDDGGATWSAPTVVSNTSTFMRDVQVTDRPGWDGLHRQHE